MMDAPTDRRARRLMQARRLAHHVLNNTSDLAPTPMRNAVSVYTDPTRHAAELQKLFRQTPVVACLSMDLPRSGSYRLFDETGVPIVVVRGGDGQVRAFLNICMHRGARLVRQREGTAKLLTCWFHGWSFDTKGELAAVPERDRFEGALEQSQHLIAVPAAERYGMVFVQATPGSTMDIDAHLGPFAPVLAELDLDKAEHVKSGQLPVKSNWKFALDTYGEGYHFAALHKATLAPYFRNDVTVYDKFGPHHRVGFASREVEVWAQKPESEWPLDVPSGVHYLFPNTIIFVGSVRPGQTYTTLFRHFPGTDVGETVTHKSIYAPMGVNSDEYRQEVEAAFDATAHVVTTEDYVTAAEGWRNMTMLPEGATVVYGRQEIALQNQHRTIADAIGMPLPLVSIAEAAE